MRFSAAVVAIAATVASAQVQNYTSSLNMTIDPNSVTPELRAGWCQGQTNTCSLLCDQTTDANDCNQATLSYNCTCSSNHSAPGLQYYTQTMPTFICKQLFSQCISANTGSADGQKSCTNNIDHLCGETNPPAADSISSDSTSTATDSGAAATDSGSSAATTATGSSTPTASSAAQTSTSKAFAAPTLSPAGTGAFAVAAVGLMAYVL